MAIGNDASGVVVTVEPLDSERVDLAIEGGEPPDVLHVTLAFFGTAADIGDFTDPDNAVANDLRAACQRTAEKFGPIAGSVTAVATLGDPDDPAQVALIDAVGLGQLRAFFVESLGEAGLGEMRTNHDFMPHMTLAYRPEPLDEECLGKPTTFEKVYLRWGTEVEEFELMGSGGGEAPRGEAEAAVASSSEFQVSAAAPGGEAEESDMPYEIVEDHAECADSENGSVAVVKVGDGEVMGCHPDAESAQAQIAALMAAEEESIEETVEAAAEDEMQVEGGGVPALADVSDEELQGELARRLARTAVDAAGAGSEEEVLPEAEAEVAEAVAEVVEDLTEMLAKGEGEDDGEPEMPEIVMSDESETFAEEGEAEVDAELMIGDVDQLLFDWEGVLTVEGVRSGDGRQIAEGGLTWRELPLPLMLQTKNPELGGGHAGAEICGSIHEIERVGQEILGRGKFDSGEAGKEAARLVGEKTIRGVSVDIDSVVVAFMDLETGEEVDFEDWLFGETPNAIELLVEGRIMGATITPFPAFQEAYIRIVDGAELEALAASGVAGAVWQVNIPAQIAKAGEPRAIVSSGGCVSCGQREEDVPMLPPADWFTLKPMPEPEPFTVHPDGRMYGLIARFGSCHIGYSDKCVDVPRSSDFRSFYGGRKIETAEGKMVPCGPLVMDTVHPDLRRNASDAQAFYAETGCQVGHVALYVNEWGIVAAGARMPGLTPSQVRRLSASDVSPDWRLIDGELKIVALLAVNTSGFIVASGGSARLADPLAPRGIFDTVTGSVRSLVAAGAVRRHRSKVDILEARMEEATEQIAALTSRLEKAERTLSEFRGARALARIGYPRG
jgi:2'-5' RNA ligase